MVKLLLELGVDPSSKDGRGYTPLGLATAKTNKAIAATLIAAGADPREQSANRPADYPWGMREMTVEDLDGHRMRMGGDGGGEYRSDAAA